MMKSFRYISFLILTLTCISVNAQSVNPRYMDRLESARKLYFSGSFYAAETAFSELTDDAEAVKALDRAELEAYKVLCAIAIDKINAEGQARTYCVNYPNSPYASIVLYTLACNFFEKDYWDKALELLEMVNGDNIYNSQVDRFDFMTAYCNMQTGDYDKAIALFRDLAEREYGKYTIPSTYFLAYSSYIKEDFETAIPLFEKCSTDSRFALLSKYYAVESRFMIRDYDYVVENAPALVGEMTGDLKNRLAKILSETYYSKGDNEKAAEYLSLYKEGGSEFTRKDYYYSGILSYSLKSYDAAIEEFSHVLSEDDDLCQSANYYSANSYLKLKNKVAALNSFKAASVSDADPVIREDAFFNFAKLSFDVNNDISQFGKYMEMYPDSGKEDTINGYMAASFLLSKDFASAVDVLSEIRNPSVENTVNLQKASFLRAMQFIESKGFRSAVPMLEISVANGRNNLALKELAQYWLAECYYRNERFADAITLNRRLLDSDSFSESSEYLTAMYNLAYCYFKNGDFVSAEKMFDDYLNYPVRKKTFESDAKVRKADAFFMQGKYADAASLYETVYNKSDDAYPAYQAALAYGLLGNDSKKIQILKQVVRNNRQSKLYPQSLFELGRTYVQKGDDEEASGCFHTLLGMESDSTFYSKALLELAMISANNNKYERAIEFYKDLVREAPYSAEVQDALSGLESVYQTLNKPEEFLSYIDEIGMSDLKSSDEKEQMIFNAAEQRYFAKKDADAMAALNSYLSTYPRGANAARATFYKGEIYASEGNLEQASDMYMSVMRMGRSDCAEASAREFAGISLKLQRYGDAVEAYGTLISIAATENARTAAYLGRMRANLGGKRFNEAIADAQMVTASANASETMLREARYTLAKSYLTLGDRNTAMSIIEALSDDPSDSYGAECAYLLILDAYDKGDFPEVENRVYSFADAGSDQLYWLAKSFIVLGDSFADRDDFAQAKATFESILEGYRPENDSDDILQQVHSRLELIKNEEGK